jgi:phage gp29-like protein
MKYLLFGLSLIVVSSILGTINLHQQQQIAQATGGAGEIKGLIDPLIDRAIEALQNNNTELALEEIQTLKDELEDTYEVDENEDEED